MLVIDAGSPGSGATAAGMGHVVVMDDSEAQFALTSYSQRLWDELELPAEADRLRCGTLWLAADEEELAATRAKAGFYRARGVEANVLDAANLREAEPNLRHGLAGALLIPSDSVVYPPVVAKWLLDQGIARGAAVRLHTRVARLEGRRVRFADGLSIEAPIVINALGAWANSLTPGLPIRRRKGHLVITDRYPGFCRHQVIELGYLKNAHGSDEDSVSFNFQPRGSGQMLLGSSRQFDPVGIDGVVRELDSGVDDAMASRMIRRALEYMPGIGALKGIRTWTGFRAATPDSLPLIGEHPAIEGLWLASGHEGLGITTSLGTAELLADMIAGKQTKIPAEAYSPARNFDHVHDVVSRNEK